ncbi:hypothetical protein [Streptomonospora wellingtoniae]|uniref:Uncharacterized protein n=1 Tax=Streptomonospora wellingtoniae TaxID=3075544 RepID=A0ABU2KUI5_9ACTN|nr:hypothetical protein [Streptomonospora sp. DSM 45055]MDT0302956.1 hypothetical protein [Streptomonospora sp. DSM 45055]
MIARLFGRRPVRAAAPAEVPLSPGEIHAAISEASLHLDQAGGDLYRAAHAALDTYWDTFDPADRTAAHERISDLIKELGRTQSALARTRRGGAS